MCRFLEIEWVGLLISSAPFDCKISLILAFQLSANFATIQISLTASWLYCFVSESRQLHNEAHMTLKVSCEVLLTGGLKSFCQNERCETPRELWLNDWVWLSKSSAVTTALWRRDGENFGVSSSFASWFWRNFASSCAVEKSCNRSAAKLNVLCSKVGFKPYSS